MAKFVKKEREEWVENAKRMEKECKERVQNIAENYVRDPSTIAEAVAFGSKFHNYSVKNNQLIYSQNPYAQYVQSFPAWKKMGYSPKRGEKGLKIWVPVKTTFLNTGNNEWVKLSDATKEQRDAYKQGKLESRVSTLFKLGTVFDIAQTTYPPEKYPELFSVGYPSEMHEDICKGLIDFAQDYVHYDVNIQDLSSITLRGYCSHIEKMITINSSLKDTQKLSTMAHELGHAIRHNMPNNFSTHRKELEADALSIMIESNYGLQLTDARKEHLVEHYNAYKEELAETLADEFNEEALQENINEVLSSVFGTYSNIIEDLDHCVEKYVSHERLLEYQQEHGVELKQQEQQEQDKTMEIEHSLERDKNLDNTMIVQENAYNMDDVELSM